MWSSELTRRGLLLAGAAVLLAACQVRPVYAPAPAAGPAAAGTMVADLRSIAIEAQTDRVGQVLVNELIFALRGGAALETPRYTLHIFLSNRETDLAIEAKADVPQARLVALTATYTLTETATRRAVANGTVYTTSSYDFSSQRYANLRARQDAEARAARQAAQDIRLRLTSALLPAH